MARPGAAGSNVHSISVEGAHTYSSTEVRAAAQSVMGQPLARLDTGALRGRLEAIPSVEHADVARAWPRGVRVVVVERRPVAAIHGVNGWQLVDRHGVVFATVRHRPGGAVQLAVTTPGRTDPSTRSALAVIGSLPPRVRHQLIGVAAESQDGVQLRLKHGTTVIWGGPEGSRRKGAALAALLGRPAGTYDVSTPGLVTTRP